MKSDTGVLVSSARVLQDSPERPEDERPSGVCVWGHRVSVLILFRRERVTGEALPKIIQVVGPTASGKTNFSVRLAEALGGELINVDSMQVYRPLAVGTDKPTAAQCARVPIHGVDLIDFGPPMDASEFAEYARAKISEIHARGRCCVISGGTGLYHRAIVHGLIAAPARNDDVRAALRAERDQIGIAAMYARLQAVDPVAAGRIYAQDWVRIERALEVYMTTGTRLSESQDAHGFRTAYVSRLAFGCTAERPVLYAKIERRLEEMWQGGIIEETQAMLDAGLEPEQLPLKALGYRQAAMFLRGECTSAEALELAKRETRRFAKRQLTWFRADPEVEWLEMPLSDEAFEQVSERCRAFLADVCEA